eukprot:3669238-Rhodomonas_salina.1
MRPHLLSPSLSPFSPSLLSSPLLPSPSPLPSRASPSPPTSLTAVERTGCVVVPGTDAAACDCQVGAAGEGA